MSNEYRHPSVYLSKSDVQHIQNSDQNRNQTVWSGTTKTHSGGVVTTESLQSSNIFQNMQNQQPVNTKNTEEYEKVSCFRCSKVILIPHSMQLAPGKKLHTCSDCLSFVLQDVTKANNYKVVEKTIQLPVSSAPESIKEHLPFQVKNTAGPVSHNHQEEGVTSRSNFEKSGGANDKAFINIAQQVLSNCSSLFHQGIMNRNQFVSCTLNPSTCYNSSVVIPQKEVSSEILSKTISQDTGLNSSNRLQHSPVQIISSNRTIPKINISSKSTHIIVPVNSTSSSNSIMNPVQVASNFDSTQNSAWISNIQLTPAYNFVQVPGNMESAHTLAHGTHGSMSLSNPTGISINIPPAEMTINNPINIPVVPVFNNPLILGPTRVIPSHVGDFSSEISSNVNAQFVSNLTRKQLKPNIVIIAKKTSSGGSQLVTTLETPSEPNVQDELMCEKNSHYEECTECYICEQKLGFKIVIYESSPGCERSICEFCAIKIYGLKNIPDDLQSLDDNKCYQCEKSFTGLSIPIVGSSGEMTHYVCDTCALGGWCNDSSFEEIECSCSRCGINFKTEVKLELFSQLGLRYICKGCRNKIKFYNRFERDNSKIMEADVDMGVDI